jgi:hypothetical protein
MLMKALALASVAFSCVSATQSGIVAVEHPEIVRVDCDHTRGTAFWVGPHILLTAAHVSGGKDCKINGEPLHVLRSGGKDGDLAVLQSERTATRWLTVDCKGFVKGKEYAALGYARGLDTQTEVDTKATGEDVLGMARLWAVFHAVPGQSGGPMVDRETWQPVGIVNVYNPERGDTGSVELKRTSICKA